MNCKLKFNIQSCVLAVNNIKMSYIRLLSIWEPSLRLFLDISGPLYTTEGQKGECEQTWDKTVILGVHSQHCLPSDRRLGLSRFRTPRRGSLSPCPMQHHHPPLPLDLDSVSLRPSRQPGGQRLTQQPHIRHGLSPCAEW